MDESDFLASYDPAAYPGVSLAVDLVLMSVVEGAPAVLLIERTDQPARGRWALPGGFVAPDESLDAAARRVLGAKAHMAGAWLEQLYTFGEPGRDPRTRIVSVAYFALLPADRFPPDQPLTHIEGTGVAVPLAFDHADIVRVAVERLRGKLDWSPVGFALLPERFTLRQLQDVHEAIGGRPLNKPAFRRRMLDRGWLAPTGEREAGTSFRPAELFTYQGDQPWRTS